MNELYIILNTYEANLGQKRVFTIFKWNSKRIHISWSYKFELIFYNWSFSQFL